MVKIKGIQVDPFDDEDLPVFMVKIKFTPDLGLISPYGFYKIW